MSMDCFIVMATSEMLIKPLCDDDAEHIFKRVYYGPFQILRFSFWTDSLTGVWVGDQKVLHLELGINWMRSIFLSTPKKSTFKVTLLHCQHTTFGIGHQRQPSLRECRCTQSLNNYFHLIAFYCICNCKSFGLSLSLSLEFTSYFHLLSILCISILIRKS
jgi:hypothetical protein